MTVWLYAASNALASQSDTLALACGGGFIWRPFYNRNGIPIACVKDIRPGDEIVLGYRAGGAVKLLARFRVGRPDKPIDVSRAFGRIPPIWVDKFRRCGYTDDPILGSLVGIFVEECEPLAGQLPYSNQNSLSRIQSNDPLPVGSPPVYSRLTSTARPLSLAMTDPIVRSREPATRALCAISTPHDGVHVGIDVGGRPEKGFDLCITTWMTGTLRDVHWKRIPHATPMPPTSDLRARVRDNDLAGFASLTQSSACATAAGFWREIGPLGAAGVHIDSPSAFSRNRLRHGRLCEKRSITGVSFQATPSIACGNEHGGDWGWLVYGMVAFAAFLHRGQLTNTAWMEDLECGTFARSDSCGIVLRECFPTATISMLRSQKREADVARSFGLQTARRRLTRSCDISNTA
jgi:hypothetical protein